LPVLVQAGPESSAKTEASKSLVSVGVEGCSNPYEGINWEHELQKNPSLKRALSSQKFAEWHDEYDTINWEEEATRNPVLAAALSGSKSTGSIAAKVGSNCQFTNCIFKF
jgi:hypothetical protein